MPVVVQSKAYVRGCSIAVIARSNPADGWCSSLVFGCCVGSGLYHRLITHSEESYELCVCLSVCDTETSTMR
jgi:hypothetical protein